MPEHKRTVGDQGQVTIPKEQRDCPDIEGGDEVEFVELDAQIISKLPLDAGRLAEGYRMRAGRSRELAAEMEVASTEATKYLGDAPGWSE
jgi:AbrB family looped-hinge helix DNA binding protein